LLSQLQNSSDEALVDAGAKAAPQELVILERILAGEQAPRACVETCHRDEATLVQERGEVRGCREHPRVRSWIIEKVDWQIEVAR
jgi:hypothetical protein